MSLPPPWFRSKSDREPEVRDRPKQPGPRVVIIGPCAAGKSTLAEGLRSLGFDAVPVGQEHSDIPTLWRHTDPDIVVSLEADLETIRRRRAEASWPEWLYAAQHRRLQDARDAAALRIDTATSDALTILHTVADFIAEVRQAAVLVNPQLDENDPPG